MTINGNGQPSRNGGVAKKVLATSLVGAVLAGSALIGSAQAEVTGGQTIEAFIGTNLVGLYGYTPGEEVRLEVIRNGQVIGHATKTASMPVIDDPSTPDEDESDPGGFIEINHGGTEAGDCFDSEFTPNIRPGDTLQTTSVSVPPDGASSGVDSDVVRDLGVKFNQITTNTRTDKITVSGHARSTAAAPIVPRRDVLELRLNKAGENPWEGTGGRTDLRVDIGRNLDAQGNFTRVLRVSHNDAVDWKRNPGEVALEWSQAAAGEVEALPPAIFVADKGPGVAAGCPPLAG